MTHLFNLAPLTMPDSVPLWLSAVLAAVFASAMRVWRERTLRRRAGLRSSPLLDAVPDVVLGTLAGVCLVLLDGEFRPFTPGSVWLLATLGGAAGPKLLESLSPLVARVRGLDESGPREERRRQD
ncbi:hypothetical protein MF271_12255 [Deinococcus sp. KNUC1210]|uniref:hypothetical protein n=1 Tax=Deinococcus sp. KNUC1210 TaxID=2917691 RepID=UPI001EF10F50|nr:hypothetical protein [Deinococcus sp. KNUC1210]ULH14764.1 hypothetical protein MF271_12255 [Deinococcus sp. KNUC1210]